MSSPSADVRLNVAANSAAAQLEMMTRKFRRLGNEVGRTSTKSKQAGNPFQGWAGGVAKATANLVVMGGAVTAIYGTAQLIAAEFRDAVELSSKIGKRQESYQQSLKKFSFANIPATVKNRDEFLKMVDKTVKSTGVEDQVAGLDIVRTFMSTMGDAKPETRVESAGDFIRNNRHLINANDIEGAKSLAGVVAMAQLAYSKDGSNIGAQIGFMNQANNIAATADPANFATNIAPSGNKLSRLGANQVEALSLAAALSNALNDQTGQLVETAAANIAGKMKMVEARFGIDTKGKTFLERQAFIRSDDPVAKQARQYLLGAFAEDKAELTDAERMSMSQAEMNRELLPKLGGRAKTLFTAMDFFQVAGAADGEGSLNKLFRSAMAEMGAVFKGENQIDMAATYKNAQALQNTLVENAEANPLFGVANRRLDWRERTESIQQSEAPAKAMYEQMASPDTDYDQFLQSVGVSASSRMYDRMITQFSPRDEESLIKRQRGMLTSEFSQRARGLFHMDNDELFDYEGKFSEHAKKLYPELFNGPESESNVVLAEAIDRLNESIKRLSVVPAGDNRPQPPAAAAIGKQ